MDPGGLLPGLLRKCKLLGALYPAQASYSLGLLVQSLQDSRKVLIPSVVILRGVFTVILISSMIGLSMTSAALLP